VGKLQTIDQFDLSDSLVKAKLRERFGDSMPKNETVVSPTVIFASELLVKVYEE
jgi:hypothetical protein